MAVEQTTAGDEPDATAGTAAPSADAAAPDWAHQTDEIHCPMCEYNLYGLAQPRCPECGYRFAWKDLLDARVRPHPYLFEHHPESNWRSFWKTAIGGLRPWRFWREVHPAMSSRPRRLLAYWLLIVLLAAGALIGEYAGAAVQVASAAQRERARILAALQPTDPRWPAALAQMDAMYPLPPRLDFFLWVWDTRGDVRIIATLLGIAVVWPWMTYALLMIFQASMRRARVRRIHVLRCIVYSYDGAVFAGMLLLFLLPVWQWASAPPMKPARGLPFGAGTGPWTPLYAYRPVGVGATSTAWGRWSWALFGDDLLPAAHLVLGAVLAVGALKLVAAYRRYLKFDWPIATVLATQAVLLLACMVLAFRLDFELTGYWRHLMGYWYGAL
jgi:hypothetical protein